MSLQNLPVCLSTANRPLGFGECSLVLGVLLLLSDFPAARLGPASSRQCSAWWRMIWCFAHGACLTAAFFSPFYSCHSCAVPVGSGGGLCGCRGEHWHGLSLMMLLLRSSLAPPVMPITCPRRGNSGWEAPACGGLWGDLFLPLLLTQQNWCWNHSYFINTFTAIKNIIHRDPLLQLPCLYMHSTSHAHYFLQHVNT